MKFQTELDRIASGAFDRFLENEEPSAVKAAIARGVTRLEDMALLLSPGAQGALEAMARESKRLTRQHYGHTMNLYAPLYVSDYCVNQCTYCGFRVGNQHNRSKLEAPDIHREGQWLSEEGFRNILLVAGESRKHCSMDYLEEATKILTEYVPYVGIEIYPLEVEEYARLHRAGVESLALYQETYDRTIYAEVHPGGPKADFDYRVEALERGCKGGFNAIGLGILVGLAPWRRDMLALAAQGRWLERRYPGTRIGFSLPRLRPAVGMEPPKVVVTDREFAQALMALRLWIPPADITLSTRETPAMRDGLIPIVINRISAGSCTAVGGYGQDQGGAEKQFEISDERDLKTMCGVLKGMGLDPVMNDWVRLQGVEYA